MKFCSDRGTVGEFIKYRWPDCRLNRYLPWPPDAFAVVASILKDTGTYLRVLNMSKLVAEQYDSSEEWRKTCIDSGRQWREKINDQHQRDFDDPLPHAVIPEFVKKRWRAILNASAVPMSGDDFSDELVVDLLSICVAADTASAGMGLHKISGKTDAFMNLASVINEARNDRQNFCFEIDTRKTCVMPKLHTPQRGLTIRSLSHHLALINSSELRPNWWASLRTNETFDILNLLLLPWPTQISSEQFKVDARHDTPTSGFDSASRLFSYQPPPQDNDELRKKIQNALKRAKVHAQRIHAIILPELSLDEDQYTIVEEIALEERVILIAGVHMQDDNGSRNAAVAQPLGFSDFQFSDDESQFDVSAADLLRIVQLKHHRWCLDRNQIIQYGLGGRLPASKDCWENILLEDRNLNFFTFANWMTMSVLVCEDLARQDPVSEALRAVAPGLVVALLMDGPQLMSRWSSRYATVLAEDPGCSVLTITSLGMSERSKPPGVSAANDKSRVIALWRDPIHGAEEIRVDDNATGCVLSLVCRTKEETTADGRRDGGTAFYPVYAGVHQVEEAP